ncbi:MAG: DUF1868 domain-containing protein [Roseobacter sp.]
MEIDKEIVNFLASHHTAAPAKLGQRYDASGFLPEVGNTIVCPLDFDAPEHRAVLEARSRLMALPEANKFLFTPTSSLHMTLFEGVIDTRRTPDAWPDDMDLNAPVQDVTEMMTKRLHDFSPCGTFSVRVAGIRPTGLILEGATSADAGVMRAWREALTVPFGYRQRQHDAYRFHMTFAYPLDWLSAQAAIAWQQGCADIVASFFPETFVLPLMHPAFCYFEDMTAFHPLHHLQ